MQWSILPILPAFFLLLVSGTMQADADAPGNLFVLSKDTTVIVGPVRADGAPDYVAALNGRQSKNVTPANNAFAAILEATSPDAFVLPDRREQFLKLCQMNGHSFETLPLPDPDVYIMQHAHLTGNALYAEEDKWEIAKSRPWSATEFPLLSRFLKEENPLLEKVRAVSQRPHWYLPYVDSGRQTLYGVNDNFPTRQIAATMWLLLTDATYALGQGHFDVYLADLATVKKFSQLTDASILPDEELIGSGPDRSVTESTAAVIAGGYLSKAQRDTVQKTLASFPPLPSTFGCADVYYRWLTLDVLFVARTHQINRVEPNLRQVLAPFQHMSDSAINWPTVFRAVNREIDATLAPYKEKDFARFRAAAKVGNDRLEKDAALLFMPPGHEGMTQAAEETATTYSERIGKYATGRMNPQIYSLEEISRKANFERLMLTAMFAAAAYRDQNGHWPHSLRELVPACIEAIPVDIYSPKGEPVRYRLSDKGPFIYSVGENGRDDGGIARHTSSHDPDDFGIGIAPQEKKSGT